MVMGTKEADGSPKPSRRERSFFEDSPLRPRREVSFIGERRDGWHRQSIKRERTFYKPSQFRDSSPTGASNGGEKSGQTRSPTDSSRTRHSEIKLPPLERTQSFVHSQYKSTTTSSSNGSIGNGSKKSYRYTQGPVSVGSSALTEKLGVPEVPLAESPLITTTAGTFRLNYNELNKLSFRRITQPEPPTQFLRTREQSFVNDAIVTERSRTKYKDIIPPYDAKGDYHATAYFKRPDIRRLLNVTCTLKPWERDVKTEYVSSFSQPY